MSNHDAETCYFLLKIFPMSVRVSGHPGPVQLIIIISASAHLSNIHTPHSHLLMNQTSGAHTRRLDVPQLVARLRNNSTGSGSFPVSGCVRGNRASGSISDTRKQNSDVCAGVHYSCVRTRCSSCSQDFPPK